MVIRLLSDICITLVIILLRGISSAPTTELQFTSFREENYTSLVLNPCMFHENDSHSHSNNTTEDDFLQQFSELLNVKEIESTLLSAKQARLLIINMLSDIQKPDTLTCADKILHSLDTISTPDDMETISVEQAFQSLYVSMIQHYFHVLYSVTHEHQCLSSNHINLAGKMNTLTCSFHLSVQEAGYSTNITSQGDSILDTNIQKLTDCTDILNRDCAVLGSTLRLMNSLISFIEGNNLV